MKKYSILLAITALIIASLACQTVMGGGDSGDDVQVQPLPPEDNGNTSPQTDSVNPGDVSTENQSGFPVPNDAFNVFSYSDPATVTFQTNMSSDDVIKFYKDEFSKLGYTEDTGLSTNFSGVFTLAFNGHESGQQIFLAGAPVGDGSVTVTITLQ